MPSKVKSKIHQVILPSYIFYILLFNSIAIDIWILYQLFSKKVNVLGVTSSSSCPQACIDKINAVSSSKTGSKESYVPLGSGFTVSKDWEFIYGAQATIDSSKYGVVRETVFEATIGVPTGNQTVWVRLFNNTDKHPVWFSEMSMSGAGPVVLTSPAITLDKGSINYIVQMKTQIGSVANLTSSRIKIVNK